MFEFPVKRGNRDEILKAIEDLEARGFAKASEIVQVVNNKRVDFRDEYLYSQFMVKMREGKK